MRILHVSASDRQGGASRAAWRLHRALRERGLSSRLLVAEKTSDDASVETIAPNSVLDAVQAQANAVVRHVYGDTNRTDLSNTHFSLPLGGLDLSQHHLVQAADVIHLHWVSSLLSPGSIDLLRLTGKPVVWTLHDMEPFTGGCHFPAGCTGYTTSCSGCPQLRTDPFALPAAVLRDKIELLNEGTTLIAPSRWMADRARESQLFRHGSEPIVVPNCVDTRVFGRYSAAEARHALGLAPDAAYILCVVDEGLQTRKGIHLLGQIMQTCAQDPRFQASRTRLLWVGAERPERDYGFAHCDYLGYLPTEHQMAVAYAAADVVLLPSLEDNLPNVMLEALASGRPLAAFGVGGIPEVVQHAVHGRLAPPGNVASLAQSLVALLEDSDALHAMQARCRSLVEEQYSCAVVAERHALEYESALARHTPTRAHTLQPACVADTSGPAVTALLPELRLYCLVEQVRALDTRLAGSEQDRHAQLTVIEALAAALAERLSLIQQLDSGLAERLKLIERMDSELAERSKLVERLHSELAVRLTLIERLDSELAERSGVVDELQTELARRSALIDRLQAELAELQDRELAARLSLIEELDSYRKQQSPAEPTLPAPDDTAASAPQPAAAPNAPHRYTRAFGLRQHWADVLNHFVP